MVIAIIVIVFIIAMIVEFYFAFGAGYIKGHSDLKMKVCCEVTDLTGPQREEISKMTPEGCQDFASWKESSKGIRSCGCGCC